MAQSLKIRYSSLGIQQKLLIPAIGFCLLVGLTILPAMWVYLDNLDRQQSDRLGYILVSQLADQARQPMLYKDKISLQVLVDRLANDTENVLQAAIFNADQELQVQSNHGNIAIQHLDEHQLRVYNRQINLEQNASEQGSSSQAQITIDTAGFKSASQTLFLSLVLVWLMLSALLWLGLAFIGRRLAQRISDLVISLPGDPNLASDNEITRLEASIKPLLIKPPVRPVGAHSDGDAYSNGDAHSDVEAHSDKKADSLILSICCENIQQLQGQLTQQNYRYLLWNFDALSNCAIKLFDGTRLPGSKNCIHIIFSCDGDQDNALLRALSCYSGIAGVLRSGTPASGSGFILRAAIRQSQTLASDCQFKKDQVRERELQELKETIALAKSWQLIIEAGLVKGIAEESIKGIAGGSDDRENVIPGITLSYETFQKDQVLFTSLGAEHQQRLAGQLAYLHSQMSEQVVPS